MATARVNIRSITVGNIHAEPGDPAKVTGLHRWLIDNPADDLPAIDVRARDNGTYRIHDGRHRFLAYVLAERETIPIMVTGDVRRLSPDHPRHPSESAAQPGRSAEPGSAVLTRTAPVRVEECGGVTPGTQALAQVWPTFGLCITTPRLTLRLPDDAELTALARLAADGVHPPDQRPFLTPWAEGIPEDRAKHVVQEHWWRLGTWAADHWSLGLAVFVTATAEPIGVVTLRSRDFAVTREVTTSSWLGLPHQRQGYGTEARAGLLTLAFDHLGATDATTEVFGDNHSSHGVSRKLGYQPDGISRDPRDGEVVVSDRLRLTRDRWADVECPPVTVTGLDQARRMFG
jgi:RimJ/RimL family protein N-acetyltransferase